METETHLTAPSDAILLAYGRQVHTLLSSSTPASWKAQVWDMFGGYILAQRELGYTAELSNIFWSFKELVEFLKLRSEFGAGRDSEQIRDR